MCPRTNNPAITNQELSLTNIKEFFPAPFIKRLNNITLCGNYGEPIVAKDCLEIVRHFKTINPDLFVSINTNAGARDKSWWTELAGLLGKRGVVMFGIDGLEDTNHIYRVGVKWTNAINNAKYFIEAGGRARWDFIAFKHNEHQVEEAREFASTLGFESFRLKKTYRFGKYKEIGIYPSEKYFNENTQVFDKSATDFDDVIIDCKVKSLNEIYISAKGLVFPCCWLASGDYDDTDQIWNHVTRDKISLHNHFLVDIFDQRYFDQIEESWSLTSIQCGKNLVCAKFCGKNRNLWDSQFK